MSSYELISYQMYSMQYDRPYSTQLKEELREEPLTILKISVSK